MFSAPTIGALVALWGFLGLLLVGWMAGELDARRTALFVGLWVVGPVALEYFLYGLLFTPLPGSPRHRAGLPHLQGRCEIALSRAYFSRTREPLIFWLLSALRKLGTRRSISSK
jgi:hypothetical protein